MEDELAKVVSSVRSAIKGAKTKKKAQTMEDQSSLGLEELVRSSCLEGRCRDALVKAGAPKTYLKKDIGAAVLIAVREVSDKRMADHSSSRLVEALQRGEWLDGFLEEFLDMNAIVLRELSKS